MVKPIAVTSLLDTVMRKAEMDADDVSTDELVRRQAYQGIVIQIQYASPVGWAPEVEDEMVKGVIGMVKSVFNNGGTR